MKSLAELALSLCDLAEAEGRALRRGAILAGRGCSLTIVGALFIAAALGFLTVAIYELLCLSLPNWAALLIMAVINAFFAIMLMWSASRCMPKRTKPKKPRQKN